MLERKNKLLLKSANLHPVKHMGQNFLVSEEIIERIISEAKITTGENILEVGPGTGNLTQELINAGATVTAVEKDDELVRLLNSKLQNPNNKQTPNSPTSLKLRGASKLQIINQDILGFDETVVKYPYRVIANIPYYLTGKLIQKFLLSPNKPSELILMVQKEVGERITAQPPKANYLSSLIQFLAETEILFPVKKENFWPQPKVDSVLIKLTPYPRIPSLRSYARDTLEIKSEDFIEFLRKAFKQPRQTLFNNLKKTGAGKPEELENIFNQLKFDKKIRAQNLGKEDLAKLFSFLEN